MIDPDTLATLTRGHQQQPEVRPRCDAARVSWPLIYTVIDAYRLRHQIGEDLAYTALREYPRSSRRPSAWRS